MNLTKKDVKAKPAQIIESSNGNKYLATYSPTYDRWLIRSLRGSNGRRGRPASQKYVTALLYYQMRRNGVKYDAAIAAVAEQCGLSGRDVKRHWNEYKHIFLKYGFNPNEK